MQDNEHSSENACFDETIDVSKEASLQKALELLLAEQQAEECNPVYRPDVKLGHGIFAFLLLVLFSCGVFGILTYFKFPLIIGFFLLFAVLCLIAKPSVIWSVKIYQRYAPEKTRRACLFTPSCSQYMLLAIEKYGLIRGVIKGIYRISRCHHPNGGVDLP